MHSIPSEGIGEAKLNDIGGSNCRIVLSTNIEYS
jgi:hypothetical protein